MTNDPLVGKYAIVDDGGSMYCMHIRHVIGMHYLVVVLPKIGFETGFDLFRLFRIDTLEELEASFFNTAEDMFTYERLMEAEPGPHNVVPLKP